MTGANLARAMQLSRADRPRDGPPARGRRLHHARPDKTISFTDSGLDHADGHRLAPPADRALPHRRRGRPVGRRARGGREPRARHVPALRGVHARGDRRREDLPARAPDRGRDARSRASRSPTSRSAPPSPSCASRTRPRTCCTCLKGSGLEPGLEGTLAAKDDEAVVVEAADGTRAEVTPSRRRDRLGPRRPLAPAARHASRAARARGQALRAVAPFVAAAPRNLVNLKAVDKGYGSRSVLSRHHARHRRGRPHRRRRPQRRRQVDAAAR